MDSYIQASQIRLDTISELEGTIEGVITHAVLLYIPNPNPNLNL